MPKADRTTLKSYFETGDRPTQSQFTDFIDSSMDICASGQATIESTASLQAGTNVTLTQTGSVIQISATGAAGLTLAASGQESLTSVASLQAGKNVTLAYAASVITIATAGSFSGIVASGQEQLTSVASVQAGKNITLAYSASVITIATAGSFSGLAASGQPFLSSVASLQAGSPIILTQTGSTIKVDANTFKLAASGQAYLDTTASLQAGSSIILTQTGSTIKIEAKDTASDVATINFVIDGGGSAITTGSKGYVEVPFAASIKRWTLLGDISGCMVIDIWKDTYANYAPTVADTITSASKPTIQSACKNQDSALTNWSTCISAGDILLFNVDSASNITRCTLSIKLQKG